MDKLPVAKLNDGHLMPLVGLGTSQMAGGTYKAVSAALKAGYRHIDTAAMYGNEAEVGRAVRDSGLPREAVFITTKLSNSGHSNVKAEMEGSLDRLGLDYIDLYLIHWPVPERIASWQTIEQLVKSGAPIRSIGVSNFTVRHLKELLKVADKIPAANQVEFHPFVYDPELIKFNQDKGIQLVAYSPLTRGHKLNHPTIINIAQQSGKTPGQVLLRWCIQHKVVVIPKAVSAEHQEANQQLFDWELSPEQMTKLNGLYDNFRVTEDPESYA